ncbi:arginine decarboxylase catabolic [Photobacterium aphoticum]|uniref:Arginine decarboxylase catabolic n=1 Tax=Photobacterium aphoticum TaxID=754436 RepID=A0A090QRA4_9GAMM|nr:arginine decarboxylase catabolic [Photobacterium aphoticum]
MKNYGKQKRVLIFNDTLKVGVIENALERLVDEFHNEGVSVTIATSFDDCYSILNANIAMDCFMLTSQMTGQQADENDKFYQLIDKLNQRQQGVPVFLLAERKKITLAVSRELMSRVDEFAWLLEDTADFIVGRVVAAMRRYRDQLLPPLMAG